MKAIETVYKGFRFRSRLEARWAVFFDSLGIKWEYEKEGYEKEEHDGKIIRYLPDFFLPESETWVEVKPSETELTKEGEKLGIILDFGSPLPFITDSYKDTSHNKAHGLLILYNIPILNWGIILHPIITHWKGLIKQHAYFEDKNIKILNEYEKRLLNFFTEVEDDVFFDGYGCTKEDWYIKEYTIETKKAFDSVVTSYNKARQARFEYGE